MQVDGWDDGWVHVYGWGGWMDGWMDGWMGWWNSGCVDE